MEYNESQEATDMTIDYSIKVTQCEPMPGYKLKVTCSDGATGIFDMSRYVERGMFKPLKDTQTFDACDSRSACLMARGHRHRRGTRPLRHANHLGARAPRPDRHQDGRGLFHVRMHDGHDAPPTPRFFARPFHFPRSKCPNPSPFPRRTIGVRHRPSPQGMSERSEE